MKHSLLVEEPQKMYVLVLESGEEVITTLNEFIRRENLTASQLTAIGAFSEVELGFFDFSIKDYKKIQITEQVELLSLNGDITLRPGGGHQLHGHVVLGKKDGTAHGGHLLSAKVHPTLELMLTETPVQLHRKHDEETGLDLIDLTNR